MENNQEFEKYKAAEVETITPLIARKLLENNMKNRHINRDAVEEYKSLMQQNKWAMNGETIKISKAGKLLDGQHRLTAVVELNRPVHMMVARDLDEDVIPTIDTGRKRKVADSFQIGGIGGVLGTASMNMNVLAASANISREFDDGMYNELKKKKGERTRRFHPTEALEYMKENSGLIHSVARMMKDYLFYRQFAPISIFCALHYHFSLFDKKKSEEFWSGFVEGANLDKDHPILVLRNRLLYDKNLMTGGRNYKKVHRRKIIALCVSAFNSFCAGEPLDYNKFRYSDDNAIIINGKVTRRGKLVGGGDEK